jgi:hypothetical protein
MGASGQVSGGRAQAGKITKWLRKASPFGKRVVAAPEPPPRPAEGPERFKLSADVQVDIGCIKVFRAENFPESGPSPWLDHPDAAEIIARRVKDKEISAEQASICRQWTEQGFYVLRNAVDSKEIDAAWSAYEEAIASGQVTLGQKQDDPHPGRYANPHLTIPAVDALLRHPVLTNFATMVLGREAIPFQTILSHAGSEQAAHSDSIHMTTYPLGYLAACWIAMEDIDPDCGPLVYYPGTHRLPYLFSRDVGITPDDFRTGGYGAYLERYEPAVQQIIENASAEPHYFLPRKGDVLFWHANLLHGGSARRNMALSRKALVNHYYAQGCICYHDLSATTSAVHGPVESLPACGAENPDLAVRQQVQH